MELETLYKKSSAGALQVWTIATKDAAVITRWGQIDGAIQETLDVIKSGKNTGKKNATTPEQQAELEAQAKWEKQLKKGYVKTPEEALAGKVDEIIEGGVVPMLAHKFSEHAHKIVYPAFAQPKFDGHRCIAVTEDGKATLWTRTRKQITGLPHIIKDLEARFPKGYERMVFDGELYNHDYRDNFEDLTSFIRTPEPKAGHEAVEYHIYDMAHGGMSFESRNSKLRILISTDTIKVVDTVKVLNEDELMDAFDEFVEQGYEGLMVRNAAGEYVNKRSYDLQKVKEFSDSEFVVVGVEEGRGKLAGHAIFVCETEPGGPQFRAKMKGRTEALKAFWEDPTLAIGRKLTVSYQNLTKEGLPRFPVGCRIRSDDS